MQLKNYPFIQQLSDNDCGVAALQSIILYYGKYAKYQDLLLSLETNEEGTPPDRLKDALAQHGIKYIPLHSCLDELRSALDKGHPSLVLIQGDRKMYTKYEDEWDYGHWVVVIGYTKRSIILADPGIGKVLLLTNNEFIKRWHDVDYVNYAVITQGVS